MPQVPAYDFAGGRRDAVALPDDWFAERVSPGTVHQAVRAYLANQRQGTASTKTRGEVSGSGAKPWRQKGTGRARAGTRTSPIWTGGGTIFGPEPRDHRQRLPKGLRRLALRSVLRARLDDGALAVVGLEAFDQPRTARLAKAVAAIRGAAEKGREVLLLTAGYEENLFLSGRNIPGLTMKRFRDVTAYEVLRHSLILIEDRVLSAGSDAATSARSTEG
jgi:large subunit ribosomal protein L4